MLGAAMTPPERRASLSLTAIFGLRMLGLFLVLPVFALEARRYPGGDDPALIGFAFGAYGLTQALLQLPFGIASDRLGRKRVIVAGLLVFALGSFVAAAADSVTGLLIGRALQGAGAVSAAVTALLSDLTRDVVRTKAMALVGISIGLVFALSLVAAPPLVGVLGLSGLFVSVGVLALLAIVVTIWWVPPEPVRHGEALRGRLLDVLSNRALLRLDFGVFVLHAVQLSMWMAVPTLIVQAGLAKAAHWELYLPAVLGSFLLLGGVLFRLERAGYLRATFLTSIGLIGLAQLGFLASAQSWGTAESLPWLGGALLIFFCGFNLLEATQPSLTSRLAPAHARGMALGAYNTAQSLGLFAGGAFGGMLVKQVGMSGLFEATAALSVLWLALAWRMQPVAGMRAH